jgi:hypothetical protein
MKKIKIKDLPETQELVGCILHIPVYARDESQDVLPKMIIKSGWNKGFWCIKKVGDEQIFPVFFEDFEEVKEWYVSI